jgi:hypothetical protein
MKLIANLIVAIGALSAVATGAQAATQYSSASAFSAAVTGIQTYNFDAFAPAPDAENPYWAYISPTIAGVTFSSTGATFVISALATASYGSSFFSGQTGDSSIPSDVIVTLAGANAISFTYGSYIATPNSPVTMVLNDGEIFSQNLPSNAGIDTSFVGFVSQTPITSITFSTISGNAESGPYAYSLDITGFSLAAPVPEPETFAMMLAGLGLMGVIARRRKAKQG